MLTTTSLGSGSTVGANAYLLNSTFPANTVIPAGAIYVNNKLQGYVQSLAARDRAALGRAVPAPHVTHL